MIKTLLHGKLQPHKFHSENSMKRLRISPVILPKSLIWRGLNPGRPGASPTRMTISLIMNLWSILQLIMLRVILLIHSKDRRFYCQAASLFLLMVKLFPF